MEKNQYFLSEETTICGFSTKKGDSQHLIDICFHRNINFKEAVSKNSINIEKIRYTLNPRTDITSERYTWIGGSSLLKSAKQVDALKDSLEDIFAVYIKDVFGPENLFIKVKFDGETFKRETNYPGDAPTMKLMEATDVVLTN